ncbi:MAG: pantoate--beta-alanine ligase [Chlorobium limicola]|uniref:Pantothenate synthetase n=1 Tax=Chlorobium limicola (strain DSM 245 / NBRC 103803 / 6330) TaxID=290315 RepID=PANC_CHLL2|nr:pantoate--beta-alanine ligase [Chlorobium limicola]B3EH07.1 RecName: Full=Pantothenate synthetase; Short=PS; AltName: Full=Pantoate--beta-alanine ligase; AltName: Full=Pantoate-activating enzyme [Chlorobium limicola DSM 245]ACD89687.1 pantoate/beta-alanine ligase [Chlorobium limicola DSM 245]NTV07604.1 pantoate--beta-alanine ligase [Chlorobium limicola]NTV20601.1 pantoate--beta-alanine ligase [Chlorobium limicola]
MQIITEPCQMQAVVEKLRLNRQLIGVVMTMGALHEGHLSLIKQARSLAGTVILTIFVNPKQFGPDEDFHRYPRPFELDASHAKAAGVDYLFAPSPEAIYPEGFQTTVQTGAVAEGLEGMKRPGHFNGVATVVTKLLLITKPHIALFGEKDAQQLAVINRLVRDLNLDVRIIGAPIVREENGLAVSSRNIYLSKEQRESATVLFRGILHAEKELAAGRTDLAGIAGEIERMIAGEPECRPDYVCFVHDNDFMTAETAEPAGEYRLLIAAYAGTVRLIDNRRFTT